MVFAENDNQRPERSGANSSDTVGVKHIGTNSGSWYNRITNIRQAFCGKGLLHMAGPRILVSLPWRKSFGRQLACGFVSYSQARTGWGLQIVDQPQAGRAAGRAPEAGAFEAVVTWTNSREEAQLLRRWGGRVLDFSGHWPEGPEPRVGVDDEGVGRCGAEFLVSRGFAHFAYLGLKHQAWSDRRRHGFQAALTAQGLASTFLELEEGTENESERKAEGLRWLQALPKPVAILAARDELAREFCQVCREAGLRVPGDMAWLGVDNDESWCTFLPPALSSVDANWVLAGFQGGAALAHWMAGATPKGSEHLAPPVGVVERESTAPVAVRDPVVGEAVKLIAELADKPFNVEDLVARLSVSRRSL
jgi:LacI family transcriptional regulator